MSNKFQLSDKFLSNYRNKQPNWGFGTLSYLTYKRTYARLKEDGTQEEFFDTIKRCVEGSFTIQLRHCKNSHLPWDAARAQRSAQIMFEKMWNFKFLPPGRGMWVMGTPIIDKLGSTPLLNCGFVSTKDINKDFAEPFAWACDMLMLGVGIGYDTLGAAKITINSPKEIPSNPGEPAWLDIKKFQVPDTREGWVQALRELLESYTKGITKIEFDYSLIRPAGTPIKGFGGTASGPEPLKEGLEAIRKLLDSYDGKPLDSVGIVDIFNYIGKFVVAGNVRRSAEIAVGDINDTAFISMKDFNKYPDELIDRRWMSNNSVVAKPDSDFSKLISNISLNGEPGLIFLDTARAYGRIKDGRRDPSHPKYDQVDGFNPCKPLNSTILTPNGYVTFEQALNSKEQLEIVDNKGKIYKASKPFKTGENRSVYRILLSNGKYLYGTGNHLHINDNGEWVSLDRLEIGDKLSYCPTKIYDNFDVLNVKEFQVGLLCGWVQGDGWFSKRTDSSGYNFGLCFGYHELDTASLFEEMLGMKTIPHAQKPNTCRVFTSHNSIFSNYLLQAGMQPDKESVEWLYGKSKEFKLGFIKSIFTADGSVRKNNNVELYSINRNLLEVISNILNEFGIYSTVCLHSNSKSYIAKDGKVRNNKTLFKLNVYAGQFTKIGFISEFKNNLLSKQKLTTLRNIDTVSVVDIEPEYSVEDVYDITVESNDHLFIDSGIITHNCAEQSLKSFECCNLVETFPANHDTVEEFHETLKYAYLYAKSVTLLPTHCEKTNQIMLQNRRIGCSQSGIQQAIKKFGIQKYLNEFCHKGYEVITNWDQIYSRWLGIPTSIKMTTVKPSGTISLLAGATPGVHCTHSEYYMRTIRIAANSPLIPKLKKANYKIEVSVTDPKTLVVYFPVKEHNYTKSKYDISLWEQLTLVKELQYYWSDNAVSCTVTFKPEEVKDLQSAIEYFAPYVKTLSFLPLDNHNYAQAPYQTCTEQEYLAYEKSLKELDLTDEKEESKGEKYCTNDSCSI